MFLKRRESQTTHWRKQTHVSHTLWLMCCLKKNPTSPVSAPVQYSQAALDTCLHAVFFLLCTSRVWTIVNENEVEGQTFLWSVWRRFGFYLVVTQMILLHWERWICSHYELILKHVGNLNTSLLRKCCGSLYIHSQPIKCWRFVKSHLLDIISSPR